MFWEGCGDGRGSGRVVVREKAEIRNFRGRGRGEAPDESVDCGIFADAVRWSCPTKVWIVEFFADAGGGVCPRKSEKSGGVAGAMRENKWKSPAKK